MGAALAVPGAGAAAEEEEAAPAAEVPAVVAAVAAAAAAVVVVRPPPGPAAVLARAYWNASLAMDEMNRCAARPTRRFLFPGCGSVPGLCQSWESIFSDGRGEGTDTRTSLVSKPALWR